MSFSGQFHQVGINGNKPKEFYSVNSLIPILPPPKRLIKIEKQKNREP